MKKIVSDNFIYFKFENLNQYSRINHFVSSKYAGVSKEPFNTLNIGFTTGDDYNNVLKNRKILSQKTQIPLSSFVMQNQIHGDNICIVEQKHKGKGVYKHTDSIPNNDALITNQKGICLFVFSADCVPVLLFDFEKNVVSAIHAGWRGTVKKIVEKTVKCMINKFRCNPKNIIAGIGPSISVENYEVGSEVVNSVVEAFGTTKKFLIKNNQTNKYHFNQWYANEYQLLKSGIPNSNIEISNLCTFKNSNYFYSSRKNKGVTGRFGAGITLI